MCAVCIIMCACVCLCVCVCVCACVCVKDVEIVSVYGAKEDTLL